MSGNTRRVALALLALIFVTACSAPAAAGPSAEAMKPLKNQLDKQLRIEVLDTTLEKALEFLEKQSGLTFFIDRPALLNELENNISLQGRDITVAEALDWVCAQAQVDWDVRKGRVFISTREQVIKPYLKMSVYDVRALTQAIVDFPSEMLGAQSAVDSTYMHADGGVDIFGGDPGGDDAVDIAGIDGKELAQLVQQTIRDGNWDLDVVTIRFNKGLITVVNTPDVQAKVGELLEKYQKAYGKLISIDARYLRVPTDTLDALVKKHSKGALVLPTAGIKELLEQQNVDRLGGVRTVCFNTQLVSVDTGNIKLYLSDIEPVTGGGGAIGVNPTISGVQNTVVMQIRPTASFDDASISLMIQSGIVTGVELRQRQLQLQGGVTDRTGHTDPVNDEPIEEEETDESSTINRAPKAPKAQNSGASRGSIFANIEVPDQDITQFRTSLRVTDGGGAILSGHTVGFQHKPKPGTEVVLLIQAKVTR